MVSNMYSNIKNTIKYKYQNAGWPISVFLTSITLFVQSCLMEMYDHRGHFNIGYEYIRFLIFFNFSQKHMVKFDIKIMYKINHFVYKQIKTILSYHKIINDILKKSIILLF